MATNGLRQLAAGIAGPSTSPRRLGAGAAPFRGIPQLPLSSLGAASPVLSNPANLHRAVPLTYEQFRYQVDTRNPDRGPMLIVSGKRSRTRP